jgi:hypothetical protein
VLVAGTCLSKLSGPILVPIALVMLAVRVIAGGPLVVRVRGRTVEYRSRASQLLAATGLALVFALVTWALIWASYGFRYTAFGAGATGADAFLGQVREDAGLAGSLLSLARQWHLLPEAYVYGAGITAQFASERAALLNGEFSTTGWWWYFPYAFLVKTTLPGLLIGVLALIAFVTKRAVRDAYTATPLLALIAVYWAFALTTNLNIGQRHLLPTYPRCAFWPAAPRSGSSRCSNASARRSSCPKPRAASPAPARRRRVRRPQLQRPPVSPCLCSRDGTSASHSSSGPTTSPTSISSLADRRRATSTWRTARSIGDRICPR